MKNEKNKRGRAYRRCQRRRIIHHKKMVSYAAYGMDWYQGVDGKYCKGHIGCGCGLCKPDKRFRVPSLQNQRQSSKWDQYLKEYSNGIADDIV